MFNIVLKKNKLLGTNGNIYSSYSQAFYGTTELGGAINYRKNKILRKPNVGMLDLALTEFNINLNKSIMLGDKDIDYMTAKKKKN